MTRLFILILFLPLISIGQQPSSVQEIDSVISKIENDSRIIKKIYDTTTYDKEDGGTRWDSTYHHSGCIFM